MRRNASVERKAVYELLHSEWDRGRRYGIQPYEIAAEAMLGIEATMVALGWLKRHGLVEKMSSRQGWRFRKIFSARFCWIHGEQEEGTLDCPKCVRKGLLKRSNNKTRGKAEGNIQCDRDTELYQEERGSTGSVQESVAAVS